MNLTTNYCKDKTIENPPSQSFIFNKHQHRQEKYVSISHDTKFFFIKQLHFYT